MSHLWRQNLKTRWKPIFLEEEVIKFLCDKSLGAVESCREMLKAMDIVDLYLEDRNTDLEIH